jgi:hypothetical protein
MLFVDKVGGLFVLFEVVSDVVVFEVVVVLFVVLKLLKLLLKVDDFLPDHWS